MSTTTKTEPGPGTHARGRVRATKPLAAGNTATNASTHAKRTSSGPPGKKPSKNLKSSTSSATSNARVAPGGSDQKLRSVSESAKSRATQPTKPSVKKEPLKKQLPQERNITPSDIADAPAKRTDASGSTPIAQGETNGQTTTEKLEEIEPVSQPQPAQDPGAAGLPLTSDPLQIAAQTYPWLYMNSTLEACFAGAEKAAQKELDEHESQLKESEARLADDKVRYDSERMIEFCDELATDAFAKDAPAIMQSFLSHGEECTRVEGEALQLATTTPSLDSEEPLQAYQSMLDNLDDLQEQASALESSILLITGPSTHPDPQPAPLAGDASGAEGEAALDRETEDANSARAQIVGVFAACLPVLRARIANLTMAQELIDSAQENFSLALRMESMGIE